MRSVPHNTLKTKTWQPNDFHWFHKGERRLYDASHRLSLHITDRTRINYDALKPYGNQLATLDLGFCERTWTQDDCCSNKGSLPLAYDTKAIGKAIKSQLVDMDSVQLIISIAPAMPLTYCSDKHANLGWPTSLTRGVPQGWGWIVNWRI